MVGVKFFRKPFTKGEISLYEIFGGGGGGYAIVASPIDISSRVITSFLEKET